MDFSFQEKSAWGLLLGIALVSAFYFPAAFRIVEAVPNGAALIAISVAGIVALIVIEVVYHAVVAGVSRDTESDERDLLIDLKAERNAGLILGFGLFWLVGHIIARSMLGAYPVPKPLEIAVWILVALTVAEIAKLVSQIWYYRAGS